MPTNSSNTPLNSDDLRRAMRELRMMNVPPSSPAYTSLSRQLNQFYVDKIFNQFNQFNTAGQAGVVPAPITRSPKAKPKMKPEFEVGDIVVHSHSHSHWRIVRVNKDSYRVVELNPMDYQDDSGESTWTFETHQYMSLVESPDSKPKVDFDTVIIADEKRQQILEALEQINQSDLIFKVWGFGDTMEKGKGVGMLFFGPPGTGKTLMAQAIANKLGYKLKIIGTADIESSKPGEAERNIRKFFKEAKDGKTILLFDECDSLIYSRQYVGAIMAAQINELLSQMERFDGITLFTTNRLGTLDEAVNRRLALKLAFEMPTPSERAEIWQRMFPKQAPLADDIDWLALAGVEITGGYIKNCVLRAARMAAIEKVHDSKKMIRMEHLVKAVELETVSMVEFEDAREAHASGYGHVASGHVRGHGTVEKVSA